MGAEVLLYGYGIVCLSMLVFNVIYSLHLRADDRRTQKRVEVIQRQAEGQLEKLRADVHQPLQASHLAWMRRRLARISYLLAFDRFLDEQDTEEPAFREYLRQLQPVFLYLSTVYWKREDTQAAYYCHFLARHRLQRHMELDQVQRVVLSYLKKDSLYCRLNALKALCSFGSPAVLVSALTELSRGENVQLHEKVVTEALLTYTGNADALIDLLWQRLERFALPIQRSVLDYIRFQSGDYRPQMEEILRDGGRDKELRLAAIRYFGRYPDEGVRGVLLGFVRSGDALQWEYAAIAATALARYPGQDVVDALMGAMHSSNWYVRYNASASLEAHGLSYEGMMDILAGDDRYAREMLNYRLESRRLQRSAAAPREKEAVGV